MSVLNQQTEQSMQAGNARPADSQEWGVRQQNGITYQNGLRAIGRFLEDQNACRVQLMELGTAYLIRYQRSLHDPTLVTHDISHAELLILACDAKRRRLSRVLNFSLRAANAATKRYESIFRALGHELDGVHADGLIVDEVDDGFLTTYHWPVPTREFAIRKRMVFLDLPSIDAALGSSHSRDWDGGRGLSSLMSG